MMKMDEMKLAFSFLDIETCEILADNLQKNIYDNISVKKAIKVIRDIKEEKERKRDQYIYQLKKGEENARREKLRELNNQTPS